jgi:hypothetical protein
VLVLFKNQGYGKKLQNIKGSFLADSLPACGGN